MQTADTVVASTGIADSAPGHFEAECVLGGEEATPSVEEPRRGRGEIGGKMSAHWVWGKAWAE